MVTTKPASYNGSEFCAAQSHDEGLLSVILHRQPSSPAEITAEVAITGVFPENACPGGGISLQSCIEYKSNFGVSV
jgi:hypothetical protein